MKININHKIIFAALMLFCAAKANAQNERYRTDVSIRDQIINGTVPGLKYAPAKPAKPAPTRDPNEGKETIRTQFKNENIPGMQFAKGGAGVSSPKRKTVSPKTTNTTLPSSSPAVVAKKTEIVPAVVPTQDGATDGTPVTTTPVKKQTPVKAVVKPVAAKAAKQ